MKIKRFIKTVAVFFAGNVLSKLVSFFLLPLYTNQFSPEQYGTYDIALSLINLIAPIAFFQIWDGMFRFSFDYEKSEDKYTVINNAIIVFFGGIILYIALFSITNCFLRLDYFIYVLIYGFFYGVQYIYTFAARVFLKNKLFVGSGLANTLVTAVLNIVLIVEFDWDIKSLYISNIVGLVIQIIIIELGIRLTGHFKIKPFDKILVTKMLKFSLPLCIATISYWLLSGFTRMLIFAQLGGYENGIYAVANRFASIVSIVVTVFQYAWNESAYLMATDDGRKNSYSICIDIMLKGVFYGTVIVCLFTKLIFPYFIAEQYQEAINIVPIVLVGVSFNSLAGFIGTLFLTEKKTNYILISTLTSAAVNIGTGYFACKYYSLVGVSIALTVAFFILMIMRLIKVIKMLEIKFYVSNLLLFVVLVIGMLAYYFLDTFGVLIALLLFVLLFLISFAKYINVFAKKYRRIKND